MEITEHPEGWWMIKDCSQVLSYRDAAHLIEEYYGVQVPEGAYLIKMTEVEEAEEGYEDVNDRTNYAIVPEKAMAAIKSKPSREKKNVTRDLK